MNVEQVVGRVLSVAVAGAFLAVGLRGLVSRRPLFLPGRWLVGIFALLFAKSLTPLLAGEPSALRHAEVISPGVAVLCVVLLVVFWFHMNGFVVYGAPEPVLRNALRHVLDARGLAHEERPGAIHIPSEQLELKLVFNEAAGTAHIKPVPARGRPFVRDVVRGLNTFFVSHPVQLQQRTFAIYTAIGTVLVAIAMYFSL